MNNKINKKTQILYIHGGNTYRSRKEFQKALKKYEPSLEKPEIWSGDYLEKKLAKDFQLIRAGMPFKENARYEEWKTMFEHYLKILDKNLVLIGVSLGGIFLAKYLSENKINKKLKGVYIIAPPYDNSLPHEDLLGGFKLKNDLSLIYKNCQSTHFIFSNDDNIVPLSQAEKYQKRIKDIKIYFFDNMNGHFRCEKFPELIKMIKNDCL